MLENLIADAPFRGEVYVHFCEISGKSYVGQTVSGMIPRWKDHVKGSRHPKYVSPLHSAETKAKLKAIRSTPEARAANSARAKAYWAAKKTAEAVQRG